MTVMMLSTVVETISCPGAWVPTPISNSLRHLLHWEILQPYENEVPSMIFTGQNDHTSIANLSYYKSRSKNAMRPDECPRMSIELWVARLLIRQSGGSQMSFWLSREIQPYSNRSFWARSVGDCELSKDPEERSINPWLILSVVRRRRMRDNPSLPRPQ